MDPRNQTAIEELTNRLQVRVLRGFHWRDCDRYEAAGIASSFTRLLLVESAPGGDGGHLRPLRPPAGALRLQPGYAYVVPAGMTFDLVYARGLAAYSLFLRLDDAFGEDLLGGIGRMERLRIRRTDVALLRRLAEGRRSLGDLLRMRALIVGLLAPLLDASLDGIERRNLLATHFPDLLAAVDRLPPARASVLGLALHLHLPPGALAKRFRRTTGVALKQFLLDRLRSLMAEAVMASSRPLAEVAQGLGFDDPFYFSRVFKRMFGLPPSHFRRQTLPAGV